MLICGEQEYSHDSKDGAERTPSTDGRSEVQKSALHVPSDDSNGWEGVDSPLVDRLKPFEVSGEREGELPSGDAAAAEGEIVSTAEVDDLEDISLEPEHDLSRYEQPSIDNVQQGIEILEGEPTMESKLLHDEENLDFQNVEDSRKDGQLEDKQKIRQFQWHISQLNVSVQKLTLERDSIAQRYSAMEDDLEKARADVRDFPRFFPS